LLIADIFPIGGCGNHVDDAAVVWRREKIKELSKKVEKVRSD
jgi:hypothetical protein